jgi:prepilin-type N-terminal cleavage/methylation domain-containing protein
MANASADERPIVCSRIRRGNDAIRIRGLVGHRPRITGSGLSDPREDVALLGNQKGISLIEIVATLAIAGVMATVAVPALSGRLIALSSATDSLAGVLKVARANSASRGAHFQVTIDTNSATTERLQASGGSWVPTGDQQYVEFPTPAYVSSGSVTVIEFDTRGLIVPPSPGTPAALETIVLTDASTGNTKTLQIWPSGQVRRTVP